MIKRGINHIKKYLSAVFTAIITMVLLTALTPYAYGDNIEYEPESAEGKMMKDEDLSRDVSLIPELPVISNDVKTGILTQDLKSSDSRAYKSLFNPEKSDEASSLSIWEEGTVLKGDVKPDNTTPVLNKRDESERAEGYSSDGKRNDNILRDSEPAEGLFKYSIQVNSYGKKSYADYLVRQLKKENYDSFSSRACNPLTKEIHYRVFVGRFNDLQSAKDACEQLKKRNEFTDNIFVVNRSWVKGG